MTIDSSADAPATGSGTATAHASAAPAAATRRTGGRLRNASPNLVLALILTCQLMVVLAATI